MARRRSRMCLGRREIKPITVLLPLHCFVLLLQYHELLRTSRSPGSKVYGGHLARGQLNQRSSDASDSRRESAVAVITLGLPLLSFHHHCRLQGCRLHCGYLRLLL